MVDEKHLAQRRAQKERAIQDVRSALGQIDALGRPLDAWERVQFIHALQAIFHGLYDLASVDAQLALTPPEGRSPLAKLPGGGLFDRCDFDLVSSVLQEAEDSPVLPYPIFGRIVCE